ncbi:hypothetical protein ACFV6F_04320 [Kitasatospora phosalacinea]
MTAAVGLRPTGLVYQQSGGVLGTATALPGRVLLRSRPTAPAR